MKNLRKFSILLLSAGVGKRLGKIGKTKPKSLLKINGKSLIQRIVDILKKREATEINIIVGYKSNISNIWN